MPWLKGGDNAATHPALLAAGARGDERQLNEVSGFVLRCYLQSAGHMTDYVVDEGTAAMLGGPTRWQELVRLAVRAGLMERVGRGEWALLDDPEFMHVRLRDDVLWERQRKRDIANEALTISVRLRDGDLCRYCGNVVNWKDRRGGRGGTYDHNPPRQPAQIGSLFVACQKCNGTRGESSDPDGVLPLRPQPLTPYYTAPSVAFLGERGHVVPLGPARPGGVQQEQQPAPSARTRTQRPPEQQEQQAAPSAPATAGGAAGAAASAQRADPHPAAPGAAEAAGSAQRPPADDDTRPPRRPAGPAGPRHTARDGPGRAGSGDPLPTARARPPQPPHDHVQPSPARSRPQRRRGARGRGARRTTEET